MGSNIFRQNEYIGERKFLEKEKILMNQVKVQFKTPEDVVDFTSVVSKYKYDMDLKKSSKKVVDAKSLLGILALGLETNLELCIYSDDNCSDVVSAIEKYVVVQ